MDCIRFNEAVPYCEFKHGRWLIRTSSGREDVADVVIAATGVLHHPHVPDIPGLDRFTGARFHSAHWDHSVPLAGRRVGVIGTGTTAIEITSALADKVASLLSVRPRCPAAAASILTTCGRITRLRIGRYRSRSFRIFSC